MLNRVHTANVLDFAALLPPQSVQTIVTSPPYFGLRSYLDADHPDKAQEIGAEPTPAAFVATLVAVFRALWPALKDDGCLWLNLGDSYAANRGSGASGIGAKQATNIGANLGRLRVPDGLKEKDLIGIPWRVALALQADGWYLRSDIVWHKPNPMPESVTDRPTRSHEYIFLLTKSARYFYDAAAIAEPGSENTHGGNSANQHKRWEIGMASQKTGLGGGAVSTRNKRDVWTVATQPYSGWAETSRLVPVAAGDASGDTKRITSPDCPVHGDRAGLVPTASYGARAADWSNHTAHTDADPVQGHQGERVPTDRHRAPDSVACSSDSPRPLYGPSAIDHSNESHRTGRAPATPRLDTPSVETHSRIGHTPAAPASVVPHLDTRESNTTMGDTAAHPSIDTAAGTADISSESHSFAASDTSCTCQLYREITEKASHYATFPPELIRPCIMAGSRAGDVVCDPFCGSGTTPMVAVQERRQWVACDLDARSVEWTAARLAGAQTRLGLEGAA